MQRTRREEERAEMDSMAPVTQVRAHEPRASRKRRDVFVVLILKLLCTTSLVRFTTHAMARTLLEYIDCVSTTADVVLSKGNVRRT